MTDTKKPDAAKVTEDTKKSQVEGEISNEELDDVSGGLMRNTGGYGTLDYTTKTSHGGD